MATSHDFDELKKLARAEKRGRKKKNAFILKVRPRIVAFIFDDIMMQIASKNEVEAANVT